MVTPDEISADETRKFQLTGIASEDSKAFVWRFVFATQIAKALITQDRRAAEKHPDAYIRNLRQFLLDNDIGDDLNVSEKFWRIIERIKTSISLSAFGLKISAGIEPKTPGAQTSAHLDILEAKVAEAAECTGYIGKDSPFYILVDQIERIWSNDPQSDALVYGLLRAAKHVQQSVRGVRAVLFLRTDIYDALRFSEGDKFRSDEYRIEWDEKSLLQLVEARATASVDAGFHVTDLWSKVFPERIGKELTSRHLVAKTLRRPRDIIQLCNACRDMAEKNGRESIVAQDIRDAIALYSNWKLNDLANEWRVNFPFINDVLLMFTNGSYALTRTTFAQRFGLITTALKARHPQFEAVFTVDAILSTLYAIGFLGVRRHGRTLYSHDDPDPIGPADTDFVIHPGFRDALKSTTVMEVAPYDAASADEQVKEVFRGRQVARRSPERLRGSYGYQYRGLLRETIERLFEVVATSKLADEMKDELRDSLLKIAEDTDRADERVESYVDVAYRSVQYLRRVQLKLTDTPAYDSSLDAELGDALYRIEQIRYNVDPDRVGHRGIN
ncbi:MAG: hypothetical protein QM756_35530 [Polyangiaceae bacterium]